jgi:hypothetical protein
MTPTLSTRLVANERTAHLVAVGAAFAFCATALLVISFLLAGGQRWPLEPLSATLALVLAGVATANLKGTIGPAFRFWRVRQALATPRFRDVLTTQARNAALDHLLNPELGIDRLQGQQVFVETEWVCRSTDLYPMLVRVVLESGGSHSSRQRFLDHQASYQLPWEALGVRGTGLKPFALHTTFGPIPVGTAHARMERARMRTGQQT